MFRRGQVLVSRQSSSLGQTKVRSARASGGHIARYIPAMLLSLLYLACESTVECGDKTDCVEPDADTDADSDTDTDSDTATDTDTDSGSDSGTDTGDLLPEVLAEMPPGADACQEFGGHSDVEGAQLWYYGTFEGDATTGWTGIERWYIFPNDAWIANAGTECVVEYDVTAVSGPKGACASCDIGFVATAQINVDNSTCAAGWWAGYETMEEPYAVETLGDGSADWYFSGSGTLFAHGYWQPVQLNYLGDGGCSVRVE